MARTSNPFHVHEAFRAALSTAACGFGARRPVLVGVLNATPDSFSDGGRFVRAASAGDCGEPLDLEGALVAAKDLVAAGAEVLDVGGESTRPGAHEVDVEVEIARTQPLLQRLAETLDVPLSIDTRKAEVAEAALRAGATIVNDVSGLAHDPALPEMVAAHGAVLIVGHMRGTPQTMQDAPGYEDVVGEVCEELGRALAVARRAGIAEDRLVVDPGIGFGKRVEDNLTLIARAAEIRERLGLPVMLGPSRKSFLGHLTGDPVGERDAATAAVCAVAAFLDADALRVHDAAGARRAVTIGAALRERSASRHDEHDHQHDGSASDPRRESAKAGTAGRACEPRETGRGNAT